MHPPQNDPPHNAPEPPHSAPKGLGITFYVVVFCYTYYVTRRKSYHEDWLMRFQICQYFITYMLLDPSFNLEIKDRIFRRDLRLRRLKGPTALIFSRAIIFWATVLAVVAVEERILLFTEKTFTVSVRPVLLDSFNSMPFATFKA